MGEERDLLLDAELLVVERAPDEEERRHQRLLEIGVDLVGDLPRGGDELVVGRALHLVAGDADQRLPGDEQRDDRDDDGEQEQLVAKVESAALAAPAGARAAYRGLARIVKVPEAVPQARPEVSLTVSVTGISPAAESV